MANIVGESNDADMTDCLCNRDAFDALAGLLMDVVGLDLASRLSECVAKGYRITSRRMKAAVAGATGTMNARLFGPEPRGKESRKAETRTRPLETDRGRR